MSIAASIATAEFVNGAERTSTSHWIMEFTTVDFPNWKGG
jgi:hypothetical protein